jgi:hypothetical protein
MPDMIMARNVLFVIIGCCIFLSLGAFFGKRVTLPTLFKYCAFVALAVVILGVIYIAFLSFTAKDPAPGIKDALLIVGALVAVCILLVAGGAAGKKAEVFRVAIGSGIVAIIAVVLFLVYLAIFYFTGSSGK